MSERPRLRAPRRSGPQPSSVKPGNRARRGALIPEDRFFRHIVSSMRNGVITFRRNGALALMNDEAYRIFGLTKRPGDVGRPFADVLRDRPEVVSALRVHIRQLGAGN